MLFFLHSSKRDLLYNVTGNAELINSFGKFDRITDRIVKYDILVSF